MGTLLSVTRSCVPSHIRLPPDIFGRNAADPDGSNTASLDQVCRLGIACYRRACVADRVRVRLGERAKFAEIAGPAQVPLLRAWNHVSGFFAILVLLLRTPDVAVLFSIFRTNFIKCYRPFHLDHLLRMSF